MGRAPARPSSSERDAPEGRDERPGPKHDLCHDRPPQVRSTRSGLLTCERGLRVFRHPPCGLAREPGHLSHELPSGPYSEIAALPQLLTRCYHSQYPFGPGEVALVDMAAILPDAQSLGLYRGMRARIGTMARSRGVRAAVGELCSATTQHVVLTKMSHRN